MASNGAFNAGWSMDENFQRALFFMDLSLQQVRLVDPNTANRIDRFYLQKIKAEFQELFMRDDVRSLFASTSTMAPSSNPASDQHYGPAAPQKFAPPGLTPAYAGAAELAASYGWPQYEAHAGQMASDGVVFNQTPYGNYYARPTTDGNRATAQQLSTPKKDPYRVSQISSPASTSAAYQALRVAADQGRVADNQGYVEADQRRAALDYNRVAPEQGRVAADQGRVGGTQGGVAVDQGRVYKTDPARDLARVPAAPVEAARAQRSDNQYSLSSEGGLSHASSRHKPDAAYTGRVHGVPISEEADEEPPAPHRQEAAVHVQNTPRSKEPVRPQSVASKVESAQPVQKPEPTAVAAAAQELEAAPRQITDADLVGYLLSRGFQVSKTSPEATPAATPVTPPAEHTPVKAADAPSTPKTPSTSPRGKNWARIAALPNAGASTSADAQFGNLKPPTPARRPARSSFSDHDINDLSPATTIPAEPGRETYAQTLRVVWVYDLPPAYTISQTSAKISEGSLLSIELNTNIASHIPGLSACIIFQHACDATRFLENNGCAAELGARFDPAKPDQWKAGETYVDNRPQPQTTVTAPHLNRFRASKDAPNAAMTLGGSYPWAASSFLKAMETHRARRRLKFARKGLFQAVPLATFKRDILTLAGGPAHIEFFHFFNAGECTVVFDSVATAICVHSAYDAWRQGRRTPPDIVALMASRGAPSPAAAQPPRRAAGIGKGGKGAEGTAAKGTLPPVARDKQTFPRGKYEGVDVGYCKDFNEDPCASLVSTYVGNAHTALVSGIRGVYQGPHVPVETL